MEQTVKKQRFGVRKIEDNWTVGKVINWTHGYLEKKGLDNPRNTTEKLMEMTLDMDKTHLYINWKKDMQSKRLSTFKQLLNRVVEGEPVAYITGVERFFSYEFLVNKDVLIPRQETEELVEWVVKDNRDKTNLTITDIGTGSGVIAITLAKLMPDVKLIATDTQQACLDVAVKNAEKHSVKERITFLKGDLLEPLRQYLKEIDVIVANPPYISKQDMHHMDASVINHEPHHALFAENDGLAFYQAIAENLGLLKGKSLYLETGFNQKEALETLFGDMIEEYRKDMNGNWRLLKLRISP
ncbi:MAG: peptide chain release factor N(5)-glutamine methyltransferase [Thermotogota bacterium]|nr:peptide chain release factor N(5)-glutamine methyltransferase [Thermotogota bacterium]